MALSDHGFVIIDDNVGADSLDCQLAVESNCQLLTRHHPASLMYKLFYNLF